MKKMIFIVAFLCGIVCAEESCYTSTESGHPQICDMQGYVCKLGVDIGAQYNAMFFYLGTDSSCSNLFKSSKFTTTIMLNYIDENVKGFDDNKTVGIIICKQNNKFVIDYCSDDRIIAREYELV